MSEEDSGSMPSDNDFSRSFSSTTGEEDGISDLGATADSWNLARTETKKVNRSKVCAGGSHGRRCRHTWTIQFSADRRKMMIFMLGKFKVMSASVRALQQNVSKPNL
jgi:hypothetical protein